MSAWVGFVAVLLLSAILDRLDQVVLPIWQQTCPLGRSCGKGAFEEKLEGIIVQSCQTGWFLLVNFWPPFSAGCRKMCWLGLGFGMLPLRLCWRRADGSASRSGSRALRDVICLLVRGLPVCLWPPPHRMVMGEEACMKNTAGPRVIDTLLRVKEAPLFAPQRKQTL